MACISWGQLVAWKPQGREKKKVLEGKAEYAVFPINLTELEGWSNGARTIVSDSEDGQASSESMCPPLWLRFLSISVERVLSTESLVYTEAF